MGAGSNMTASAERAEPDLGPRPRPMLGEFLSGRDNNLNLIRMVAASAVLVSHAFPITLGRGAEEPLELLTGMSLGGLAVAVFFALSGLLISRSFDRRPSMTRFVIARILRLFPGLLVVLMITVLAGAMLTTLDLKDYFTNLKTLAYVPRNLSLMFLQYPLPGVFADNPYPDAINGSLWTLFYEVLCYGGVVGIGLIGVLRRQWAFAAFFAAVAALFVWGLGWAPAGGLAARADQLIQLGFPFALGIAAYVWRARVLLDWRMAAALWLACVPAYATQVMPFFVIVALCYSVALLAFVPKGALLQYNRIGDYSYGMYIYAFPVQQLNASLWPESGPYLNMLQSFPIVLGLACLSWHLVEKRALDRIDGVARRLAGGGEPTPSTVT
jgi:peptidoglycan/LPS O-acetylase OafA/YrhL